MNKLTINGQRASEKYWLAGVFQLQSGGWSVYIPDGKEGTIATAVKTDGTEIRQAIKRKTTWELIAA